ncbi:putative F-box/LRR-repeat protein 9 [Rutidosis leptorrhynchoides]|uniref:putative F-box/LRR-repeat protein 9 n=1 Tax=Rutidosis leptorrhynchoides TaxID=125765 RepID=UPI003A9984AB
MVQLVNDEPFNIIWHSDVRNKRVECSMVQYLTMNHSIGRKIVGNRHVMIRSTTSWFDLTWELKIYILSKICSPQILESVQKVCTDWYKVCKDPSLWKVIDMHSSTRYHNLSTLTKMCKHVVDRSQGQLVDIVIPEVETSEVLPYVADRARQLKRLRIYCDLSYSCIKILAEALKKFPLLEELMIKYYTDFSKEVIESAARNCPLLKTLIVDQDRPYGIRDVYLPLNDEIVVAIGENLHELRHLQLFNNGISNIDLKAIMDGCHQLESLNLSLCWNIDLKGDVVKRCSEQIKHLTLPSHSRLFTFYVVSDPEDSDEEVDACKNNLLLALLHNKLKQGQCLFGS